MSSSPEFMRRIYKVQTGAFSSFEKAQQHSDYLKLLGINNFVIEDQIESFSSYFELNGAQVIKTTPDNLQIEVLGNTLRGANKYGINGTFYDERVAPVSSPNSCVFIAMNERKVISNNAQFNGWNKPPRATVIFQRDKRLSFRKLTNVNPIRNIAEWAIGGYMMKPYMDFKNEEVPRSVNYKTAHSYIGYDEKGYVYLIVASYHYPYQIIPVLDELEVTNAILLDGGGSSQLRHPEGQFKSNRKINTAITLKRI